MYGVFIWVASEVIMLMKIILYLQLFRPCIIEVLHAKTFTFTFTFTKAVVVFADGFF